MGIGPGSPAASPAGHAAHPAPSVRQLAGQRIVVGFPGTRPPAWLVRSIRRGDTGGVILMGANVANRSALARLTAQLQAISRPASVDEPLLIMVDQEGGAVRRIAGPPVLSAARMGAGDPRVTRAAGRSAGRMLRSLGVTVDLAPVADVAGPESALAREGRTFGRQPRRVARHAVAFAAGLRAAGVLATAKHFPGLGAARVNTDQAPVSIRRSAAVLRRVDAQPFAALIAHDVPLVMTSAAVYPALDPGRPALLSAAVVRGELRGRLGFAGTIITDALDTPALAAVGDDRTVAVRAAQAGNDLLLYIDPVRGATAADALAVALADGRLDRRAARVSFARVMALRAGRPIVGG